MVICASICTPTRARSSAGRDAYFTARLFYNLRPAIRTCVRAEWSLASVRGDHARRRSGTEAARRGDPHEEARAVSAPRPPSRARRTNTTRAERGGVPISSGWREARPAPRWVRGTRGPLHRRAETCQGVVPTSRGATTWGVPAYKDNVAEKTRSVVDRLSTRARYLRQDQRAALSRRLAGFNAIYGTTNNPWDVTRAPEDRRAAPRPRSRPALASRRAATSARRSGTRRTSAACDCHKRRGHRAARRTGAAAVAGRSAAPAAASDRVGRHTESASAEVV